MLPAAVVALALAASPAAARLVQKECSGTCKYEVMLDMAWNGMNHPIEYPENGMFTPFYTLTHDVRASLWKEGELASDALEMLAEDGKGDGIMADVKECGDACGELVSIKCDPPMSGTCKGKMRIDVDPRRPYLSTASMLAPSPDWFTGVDSWNPCEDGEWVEEISQKVNAYDAGTDFGLTFLSENIDSDPRAPIASFGAVRPKELSAFWNNDEQRIMPVGTITVSRKC